MKYIITIVIFLIIFACASTMWQSVEKKFRTQKSTIIFYRAGKPAYITKTSVKDAEKIMVSNDFDFYEIE